MGAIKKILDDKSFIYFSGHSLIKFSYSYNYFLNYSGFNKMLELVDEFRKTTNQNDNCFYFYNVNVVDNVIYLFDGLIKKNHIVNFTDKPLELLYEKYPERQQEIFEAYNIGFEIIIEKL